MRYTAIDHYNSDIVYAGGEDALFRSLNGGASGTWASIGLPEMAGTVAGAPWSFGWEGVFDLAVDYGLEGGIYAACYGKAKGLYYSTDAGNTWTKILSDDYLRTVAVRPSDPEVIYTGSSSAFFRGGYRSNSGGVYYSIDKGAHWSTANEGMAYPFALTAAIDYSAVADVIIGSPGSGFQRSAAAQSATSAVEYMQALRAKQKKESILLSWIAIPDLLIDHFEVQHTADLSGWQILGTLKIGIRNQYQWEHKTPLLGKNYYRIAEVQTDGRKTFTSPMSIDFLPDYGLTIFPNPASNKISWEVKSEAIYHELIIRDFLGQEILKAPIQTKTIDVNQLPQGIYYLTLRNSTELITKPFLIN